MNGSELVVLALKEMVDAYGGQLDRNGMPKAMHPLEVADYFRLDPIAFSLALLHDLKEDLPDKADAILAKFPDEFAAKVNVLTRRKDETYEAYIDRVVASNDVINIAVKAADLKVNIGRCEKLGDPGNLLPRYKRAVNQIKRRALEEMMKMVEKSIKEEENDTPVKAPTVEAPHTLQ